TPVLFHQPVEHLHDFREDGDPFLVDQKLQKPQRHGGHSRREHYLQELELVLGQRRRRNEKPKKGRIGFIDFPQPGQILADPVKAPLFVGGFEQRPCVLQLDGDLSHVFFTRSASRSSRKRSTIRPCSL